MKLRRLITAGAAAACAATGFAAQAGAASATPVTATPLRALAAPIGLRVGSAINPYDLAHADYAKISGQQFSVVTPENEMKWETVEPTQGTYDWSGGDRLVAFAQAHGQLVRGHTLLWESQLPTWLTNGVANGTISNDQLRNLLHKHITDEVTHFKGKIWQWDVANEFIANAWDANPLADGVKSNFWTQHLGEGVIGDAFRWAHAADPNALLFYNDYNITGEDGTNAKSDATYNLVKNLLAQGVPINGVGEQGHLDTQYGFDPARYQADLQRFADLGLKVAVTEADVRTFVDSPATQVPTGGAAAVAKQTQYWNGLLNGCLAVQQCISFTVWGFGDAESWVPYTFHNEGAADLYDVNLNPKATYFAVQQDLQNGRTSAPKR